MKITELRPNGFCGGVKRSIQMVQEVINDPKYPRPLYLLGQIVHNKFINNALHEQGVIILEGNSRLEMLDQIDHGTVIFTAHGISEQVIQKAKDKNLHIVNATCPHVNKSFELIKEKLAEGYTVIYIGKNHHPETEAALAIDNSIILIEKANEVASLNITNDKIALINQTTMSPYDIKEITDALKDNYPHLTPIDSVCNSTKKRQDALQQIDESVDLVIVIGDRSSNNTQKLRETSEKVLNKTTIAVENVEDLNGHDLSKYQNIVVTAGTSTPRAIINEIIETLNTNTNAKFDSQLKGMNYLNS